jgi:thiol-disulfide isomerase/thioredoxin
MKRMIRTLAVAAVAGFALFGASRLIAGTSPAPDMPGDWFWHDSAEQAKPHAELIGKPAPKIEVSKWFQNEVKVDADALKDKIVILDIWATWCGPCKAAMPETSKLAEKYKDKGVVIVAICSSGDEEQVLPFAKDKGITLPMAWDKMDGDEGVTAKAFRSQWFPTYVAIDRKGIVRAIGFTSSSKEDVIKKLLDEK